MSAQVRGGRPADGNERRPRAPDWARRRSPADIPRVARRRATHVDAAAIEALLGAGGPAALDQALMESCSCLLDVRAAALWKELRLPGRDESPTWRPVVARGAIELLPSEAMVRAALSGTIDDTLPGGACVLRAASGPATTAVVVCGPCHEDELDQIVAWLQLHDAIERVFADAAELHGPMPRNVRDGSDPPRISGDVS